MFFYLNPHRYADDTEGLTMIPRPPVFGDAGGAGGFLAGDAEESSPEGWDISTAVFAQNFDVSAQDGSPLDLFFTPDGLKMYIAGAFSDAIYQYNLSSAWDISTAVYIQSFDVSAQEINVAGLFFRDDGLKMYIIGTFGLKVSEYNLLSAWDISTAVHLQNFDISAQEFGPTGVFFKPDGLKMYVIGVGGDDVNEYNLSSAWNVSTAVYLQRFGVNAQDLNPSGLFFKPDGLKMYAIGTSSDRVNEYNLSSAWDISTAVFAQNFSVSAQEFNPHGLFFKPDGLKMYVIGTSGKDVNEYNLDPV